MAFEVLPAIDLRGGQVVRLMRGDFAAETAYPDDPADVAARFAAAGARAIHVVDLDGARDGVPRQGDVVRRIVAAAGDGVACEVAGGLRTPGAVAAALTAGARRAVVGTAALREPGFAASLIARHGPERIVAAIDVRDGRAVGEAWRAGASGPRAEDAMRALAAAGVRRFEVTAVERDGLLAGPDGALLARLIGLDLGEIVASGGVTTLADLRALRDLGCVGAIVGRALYEGRLDLAAALAAVAD